MSIIAEAASCPHTGPFRTIRRLAPESLRNIFEGTAGSGKSKIRKRNDPGECSEGLIFLESQALLASKGGWEGRR